MRSIRCGCGRLQMYPDVLRCPFCHKDLTAQTDEHNAKHVRRCAMMVTHPYMYSDHGRGRPPLRRVEAEMRRTFERHCRNCGNDCQGCEAGVCERWSSGEVHRCPFCGMNPVLVEKEGTYAVICNHCSLKMIGDDKDALIIRWNRNGKNNDD